MKPSFYDDYGRAIDIPVNAVAYELTNGGDTVRNKRQLWPQLAYDVTMELNKYREFNNLTAQEITYRLKTWLEVNEKKGGDK
jgi:hypothetical protein